MHEKKQATRVIMKNKVAAPLRDAIKSFGNFPSVIAKRYR
jgi:hypothetical protein